MRNSLNVHSKKTQVILSVSENIDDILGAWESLFKHALDLNCPWRTKRAKQVDNMPWLYSTVTQQLKKRDMLLKTARRIR